MFLLTPTVRNTRDALAPTTTPGGEVRCDFAGVYSVGEEYAAEEDGRAVEVVCRCGAEGGEGGEGAGAAEWETVAGGGTGLLLLLWLLLLALVVVCVVTVEARSSLPRYIRKARSSDVITTILHCVCRIQIV